jgi:hypothetical protein
MKQMSDYITKLEEHKNLEVSIMKATKINKVLKAIIKLESIPKEAEFHFKDRSQALLGDWNKILGTEQPAAAAPTVTDEVATKDLTNGSSATKVEGPGADAEVKGEEKSAEAALVVADAAGQETPATQLAVVDDAVKVRPNH